MNILLLTRSDLTRKATIWADFIKSVSDYQIYIISRLEKEVFLAEIDLLVGKIHFQSAFVIWQSLPDLMSSVIGLYETIKVITCQLI